MRTVQAAHLTDNVAPDVALRGCKPADVERFNPDGSRDDPFHWALLMEDMAPESDSDVTGMEAASGSSDGWRRADAVTLKRSAWVQRVWRYLAFCFDGGLALGYVRRVVRRCGQGSPPHASRIHVRRSFGNCVTMQAHRVA